MSHIRDEARARRAFATETRRRESTENSMADPIRKQETPVLDYHVDEKDLTPQDRCFRELKKEVASTRGVLEKIADYFHTRSDSDRAQFSDVIWEWRSLAMVFDRLFFWLFVLVIILSLCFLFPRVNPETPDENNSFYDPVQTT